MANERPNLVDNIWNMLSENINSAYTMAADASFKALLST